MATVMSMHWPEVSKEQYEEVRRVVNWEGDVPPGGKLHVSWWAEDGFRVFDLWDSAEQFTQFVETRLMPGVQQVGVEGQPRVELAEAHVVFVPKM